MNFRFLIVLFAFYTAFMTSAQAAQETYKCELDNYKEPDKHGRASFINGPVYLWIETGQKKAHASDPVSYTVHKQPIEVKVQKNTDKIFRANWILDGGRDTRGRTIPKFRYSLILNKQTSVMQYYADPVGFSNSFNSQGRCTLARLKALPSS